MSLLKSMVSVLIVMLGVYFYSFYLRNELSITSIFLGILGFFILFPAIKKWDELLWGKNEKDK